jgi:hypothetical protein
VSEPSPERDPDHREKSNTEDRFYEQRFLVSEDINDAVAHMHSPNLTGGAQYSMTGDAIHQDS